MSNKNNNFAMGSGLGKGEVESSILSRSTSNLAEISKVEKAHNAPSPSALRRLIEAAKEARDWFKDREDCDHDGVKYVPNDEMRLGVELDRALAELGENK